MIRLDAGRELYNWFIKTPLYYKICWPTSNIAPLVIELIRVSNSSYVSDVFHKNNVLMFHFKIIIRASNTYFTSSLTLLMSRHKEHENKRNLTVSWSLMTYFSPSVLLLCRLFYSSLYIQKIFWGQQIAFFKLCFKKDMMLLKDPMSHFPIFGCFLLIYWI